MAKQAKVFLSILFFIFLTGCGVSDTSVLGVSASPAGGNYAAAQSVSLKCTGGLDSSTGNPLTCDAIYYTTDGSDPDDTSAVYASSLQLVSDTTLKFYGVNTLGESTATKTETYTFNATFPATMTSYPGFIYDGPQSIALMCDSQNGSACDIIYYTTDGSTPDSSSNIYSVPLTLTEDTILSFYSVNADGLAETVQIHEYIINIDTDGDGLRDQDERDIYGTSPILADTDADGFSDFKEVVTFGFDATVNNFRFNPLLADIPQIDVRLTSAPSISLNYTTSSGASNTISTSRSQSSAQTVTSSNTREESTSFEQAHSFGLEIEAEIETGFSLDSNKVKKRVQLSYEATIAFGEETTNSWTEEQSTENSTALEQGKDYESSNNIDTSGGGVSVAVEILNGGDISYTLKNLYLSATYLDMSLDNPVVPVGNLAFDNSISFPSFTLAPGETTVPLNFSTGELGINDTKQLLNDSQGLVIRPANYEMLDENGVSYTFNSTGIQAQDATVIIDFAGIDRNETITKMAATNADPNNKGVSVRNLLNNIFNLNIVTDDTDGFIQSIASVSNNISDETKGYWIMMHASQNGSNAVSTTVYTTPVDEANKPDIGNLISNYDIDQIIVRGGDVLHIQYMLDDDLDGLGTRQEFIYGTNPDVADTDGDGLTDKEEVVGWVVSYKDRTNITVNVDVTSNPLAVDTDGDGLNDFVEANTVAGSLSDASFSTVRRNPGRKDTDGDGLGDAVDDVVSGDFILSNYDNLDLDQPGITSLVVSPTSSTSDVNVAYQVSDVTEQAAGIPGNGITGYRAHIYRHSAAATNNVHPEPMELPIDNVPALLGNTLSCGTACIWTLVHFSSDLPGPGQIAFVEDGLASSTQQINPLTQVYKYIVFLEINNQYKRSNFSISTFQQKERVVIHMKPGTVSGVKSTADERTLTTTNQIIEYSSIHDEIYYQTGVGYSSFGTYGIVGNVYTRSTGLLKYSNVLYSTNYCGSSSPTEVWIELKNSGFFGAISCGHVVKFDYYPLNLINPVPYNNVPPYTHPYGKGDGTFDVNWLLQFGPHVQNARLANPDPSRRICDTYRSRVIGDLSAVGTIPTNYITPGAANASCSGIDVFADSAQYNADAGTVGAIFTIDVPAEAACYPIYLFAYEYDRIRQVNSFVQNPDNTNALQVNTDQAQLCRDDNAIWSLTHINRSTKHQLGLVEAGREYTTADNINFIRYESRPLIWKNNVLDTNKTTEEGELKIMYEIEVLSLP